MIDPYLPDLNGAKAFAQSDRAAREVPVLVAERDRFKALWDGTRDTAERLRVALEYIARGHTTNSALYARQVLEKIGGRDIDNEKGTTNEV